jgi:hypothetical protein
LHALKHRLSTSDIAASAEIELLRRREQKKWKLLQLLQMTGAAVGCPGGVGCCQDPKVAACNKTAAHEELYDPTPSTMLESALTWLQ